MEELKTHGLIATYGLIIIFILALVYGGYWLAKTLSYQIFYEDMVIETIKETVKPEYLK